MIQLLSHNHSLFKVAYLVVKGKEGHRRVNSFSGLGAETNHFKPSLMYFLSELVNSRVGWGTHQHGAPSLFHQLVHDGS